MKIKSENVVLFDTTDTVEEFIIGLNDSTSIEWQPLISISNKSRSNKLYNVIRYFKYFYFPFKIFFHRKKLKNIIGWQAFYGFVFAYYCSIFHVKKRSTLIIKNFTYKPKKGVVSKIYEKFIRKTIKSKYIDKLIVTSPEYAKYCSEKLNVDINKFKPIKFAVNDFSKEEIPEIELKDYILSIGRSNRDWDFLINGYKNTQYKVLIICDTFDLKKELPNNFQLLNSVTPSESLKYIKNAKFVMIPILDGNIASGETVLATAMSLSKPVIITKPSTLAEFYVDDNVNGFSISKNINELLNKTDELYLNFDLYKKFSKNARAKYENELSLVNYGKLVGNLMLEINK